MKIDLTDDASHGRTITLDGNTATISAGGSGQGGDVIIRNSTGTDVIHLGRFEPGPGAPAHQLPVVRIEINDDVGQLRILLNASTGDVLIGGNGADGDISLKDSKGTNRIQLDGGTGDVSIRKDSGKDAIHLDSLTSRVSVRNELGNETIRLDGTGSSMDPDASGPKENGGVLILRNALNHEILRADYQWVDTVNSFEQHGMVRVKNTNGQDMVVLDGQHGDIKLAGADCAERFSVADEASRDPGTVLVATDHENLVRCTEPYDLRVAGIVSGVGSRGPGVILNSKADQTAVPVALVGKVYCKVDASYGSIACGDLLTTSRTPGHAMRAADRDRAFGAVIGKSLASLTNGTGLIPVLVALQ